MHRWCLTAALTCAAVPVATAKQRPSDRLDVYTAVVSPQKLGELESQGVDVAESKQVGANLSAQLIMTADQRARLAADGVASKLTRVKGGKTVKQFAAGRRPAGTTSGARTTSRAASAIRCTRSLATTRR